MSYDKQVLSPEQMQGCLRYALKEIITVLQFADMYLCTHMTYVQLQGS